MLLKATLRARAANCSSRSQRCFQVGSWIARDIGGSYPDVAFANAGIGTELLAHREKIKVTRSGSPFDRSSVPVGRANPPTRVLFVVIPG
jgi:hypothetical protein